MMAIMNSSVIVYIFSNQSMNLKKSQKPTRPATISISVSMIYYLLVNEYFGFNKNNEKETYSYQRG